MKLAMKYLMTCLQSSMVQRKSTRLYRLVLRVPQRDLAKGVFPRVQSENMKRRIDMKILARTLLQ
jgi:hypothetical protein